MLEPPLNRQSVLMINGSFWLQTHKQHCNACKSQVCANLALDFCLASKQSKRSSREHGMHNSLLVHVAGRPKLKIIFTEK